MSAAIILIQGGETVAEFVIDRDRPTVIGRSSAVHVHVRDAKLSRQQCEIRPAPEGYFLRDLQSKNGTFVNGARVREARLRDGDRIQVGLTTFLFRAQQLTSPQPTAIAPAYQCAACGGIIPSDAVGMARRTDTHIYCPACVQANGLIGRVVAGYEIMEPIGRGAMGTVFKAEQLSMERHVALKILHDALSAEPEAVERFLHEARAGGQFSHPNIIRIYDINQTEGYCFISMEYVPGGDVGSLVEREGPLPAAQVVDIAIQTATALAHAHGKGVIHRDVKPTNLLLGRDSLIKLADLGLAKSLDAAGVSSITASGTVLATLAYIPPEQVTNAASVDGRADIYSLGATLYHLLTGVAPFRGTNIAELSQAILTEPPRSVRAYRDDVPAALDSAIARSMAKDPAQRFQDAQSLIGSLQAMRA